MDTKLIGWRGDPRVLAFWCGMEDERRAFMASLVASGVWSASDLLDAVVQLAADDSQLELELV